MLSSLLLFALTLLTLLAPSHCGFLTSAPLQYASNASSPSPSTFSFSVTFPYLNSTLLVTSPHSTLTANLSSTLFNASFVDPKAGQAILLPDSPYAPTPSPISVLAWCAAQDVHATSTCTIPFILTTSSPSTPPTYSIYLLTNCLTTTACNTPSSTASLPSSPTTLSSPQGSWVYFASPISSGQLDAQLTVSAATLLPQLFVASEFDLFSPFYTGPNTSFYSSTLSLTSSTAVTRTSSSFAPGLYVIGLYIPVTSRLPPSPSYSLQLLFNAEPSDPLNPGVAYGYNILSVLALILAAALITLVLMRVCLLYKRRTGLLPTSSGRSMVRRLESPMGGEAGGPELRAEWERQRVGLSDEEVAALPVHRFEGVEKFDENRCNICLEDYAMHESQLTTLRCGHSMHRDCAAQWLKRAVKCPLCQQPVREGEDDKEGQQQRPMQVEMVSIHVISRPTGPALASHGVVGLPLDDPSVQTTLRGSDQLH